MTAIVLLLACILTGQPDTPTPPPPTAESGDAVDTPTELETLRTRHAELRRAQPQPDDPALIALYEDVLDHNARHPYLSEALVLQARILVMLGRADDADACYRNALTQDPGRLMDGLEWAAFVHTRDPEQAIATLRELTALAPDRMGYWMGLYEYLYKFAPDRIQPEFQQLIAEGVTSVRLMTLIETVGKLDPDLGVAFARQLHELFPDDHEVTLAFARRLRFANLYDESRALLETLPPELLLRPDIGVLYSDTLYMNHHFRRSIEHLLEFEGNVDDAFQAHNRDRDWRLNTRPKMIEYWANEQDIRAEQNGLNPRVRMTIDGQPVLIELYPDNAPTTVANFLALSRTGFYTNTPFHSVRAGFVSQGGVPAGETFPSYAGPGYSIEDESGRADARRHFAGSIVMAKISKDQLIGSQFYITHVPAHHLNGQSAVFGHVVEGLDVIRAMRGGEQLDRIEVIHPGTLGLTRDFDVLTTDGESIRFSEWAERQRASGDE